MAIGVSVDNQIASGSAATCNSGLPHLALLILMSTVAGCGLLFSPHAHPEPMRISGEGARGENPPVEATSELISRDVFLELARKAIRDAKAAIVVGEISQSWYMHTRSSGYRFLVPEVLKPYRSGRGTYYIPTAAWSRAPSKRVLELGREYILIIRLEDHYNRWQWIRAAHALSGTMVDDSLLDAIRADAAKNAKFGSSELLTELLSWRLDFHGRRSARADGYLPPEVFGFNRGRVQQQLADGGRLVLAWVRDIETADEVGWSYLLEVVEEFSAGAQSEPEALWIKVTSHDWNGREAKELEPPYRPAIFGRGYMHIFLLRVRRGHLPQMIAHMSPIDRDDATVRDVRSWFLKE